MPSVFFHVRIDDVDNCEILCSEANLAIDRADLGNCSNVVLILGLPAAITKRELEIFVDPFADGIEGLCLLKERKCFNTGQASAPVTQYKSMALVFFVDQNRLTSFKDLYNNMQLPSYSETAPCIVVQLSSLVVHCSNAALNNSGCNPVAARLSPVMELNPISASPGRPYSSKGSTPQQREKDSLLSHGTSLLMQHCSPQQAQPAASVSKASPPESTEAVAQMVALPTCTVCLRRIRCVSTLAHGLSGANDLMVGRSYTCDAKLTFDELNTMDNQKEEKEDVVVKMSGDKVASEVCADSPGGVRCIVCHIYHEVTASRSIGNPSSSGNATVSLLHRLHSLRMDSTSNSTVLATATAASDGLPPATTSNASVDVPAPIASTVSSSGGPTGVGRCRTCNLSENIWLCLQCGHTGCGRYTSQHAKAHYQDTLQDTCQNTEFSASHNLSLELASGRIWNYEADTFDYIEDESSSYFSASGPTRTTARSAFHSVSEDKSTNENNNTMQVNDLPVDLDRASPTQCKKFLLPSFLYGTAGSGRQHLSTDLLDPSSSAAMGLDDVTTDKINALMNNYERLLEAQLLDQQLYFEKLLARETVRALELSYMPPPTVEKSSTVTTNKKNKALTKKASFGEPSTSAATEEKNDDISPPVTTEDAAYSASGPSLLTDSQTYREASSAVQNPEVVQYMNEVELLKMEISTVEMQYREVLEKVKKADEATRGLKKSNDALLKGQQALKDKQIKLKARSAELQVEHEAQVSDLNQQIQDLKFYVRARKEVQESPLKDELKTGTVVTSQRNPPPPLNSANNNSGGFGGDKKVAKRK